MIIKDATSAEIAAGVAVGDRKTRKHDRYTGADVEHATFGIAIHCEVISART